MRGQGAILVVDDDASIRLLCRINLEAEGYRVLEAGDLDEALAQVRDADVVLLDLHLGRLHGRELIDPIRDAAPEVPVVLLTGSVALDDELTAGTQGVVPKPFTIDAMLDAVGRLVTS